MCRCDFKVISKVMEYNDATLTPFQLVKMTLLFALCVSLLTQLHAMTSPQLGSCLKMVQEWKKLAETGLISANCGYHDLHQFYTYRIAGNIGGGKILADLAV